MIIAFLRLVGEPSHGNGFMDGEALLIRISARVLDFATGVKFVVLRLDDKNVARQHRRIEINSRGCRQPLCDSSHSDNTFFRLFGAPACQAQRFMNG